MRLIDADKLLYDLCTSSYPQDVDIGKAYYIFKKELKNATTVDAVPVKHGHWVYKWNPYFKQELPYCSVCEKASPSVSKTDYCPHCGAVMDEVTE